MRASCTGMSMKPNSIPPVVSVVMGEPVRIIDMKGLRQKGRPIPVLIDSRYRLLDFRGLTACTPNESEVEQALGVRINDDMTTSSNRVGKRLDRGSCSIKAWSSTQAAPERALDQPGLDTRGCEWRERR